MATGAYAPLDNNPISSDICSSSSEFYESSDDSVVDKNFVPSNDDESSDTSGQRRDENYEQVKRKRRRNLGQEYSTVRARNLLNLENWVHHVDARRTAETSSVIAMKTIFTKFWDLGSYDLRTVTFLVLFEF
ncbi:unnamed protein product [Acanthoscelides obtectus]|uniref:Uncharacterized protein n=1 Tax=Acanthoscelides obtectus TaxID=200917 RepID=A0A9P0M8T1_ACAOB|nr:unnamed protein product [Acanthoscelides obtectus]CAK1664524.1 hypothetical protein AOBTE_LOCUS24311 [Acanthoscelides obtectus]